MVKKNNTYPFPILISILIFSLVLLLFVRFTGIANNFTGFATKSSSRYLTSEEPYIKVDSIIGSDYLPPKEFYINVHLVGNFNNNPLFTFQYTLTWNPNLIECFDDVEKYPDGGFNTAIWRNIIDNDIGQFVNGDSQVGSEALYTGSGSKRLARLRCKAKAEGKCNLNLIDSFLWNLDLNDIPFENQDGVFDNTGTQTTTTTVQTTTTTTRSSTTTTSGSTTTTAGSTTTTTGSSTTTTSGSTTTTASSGYLCCAANSEVCSSAVCQKGTTCAAPNTYTCQKSGDLCSNKKCCGSTNYLCNDYYPEEVCVGWNRVFANCANCVQILGNNAPNYNKCWASGKNDCNADAACHGKYPGDSCGTGKTCTNYCLCLPCLSAGTGCNPDGATCCSGSCANGFCPLTATTTTRSSTTTTSGSTTTTAGSTTTTTGSSTTTTRATTTTAPSGTCNYLGGIGCFSGSSSCVHACQTRGENGICENKPPQIGDCVLGRDCCCYCIEKQSLIDSVIQLFKNLFGIK